MNISEGFIPEDKLPESFKKTMKQLSQSLNETYGDSKTSVINFVRVSPDSGDWEAWYMDGKLIAEGHSVRVYDILDAISDEFPNQVSAEYIPDEVAEEGFDKDLHDLLVRVRDYNNEE